MDNLKQPVKDNAVIPLSTEKGEIEEKLPARGAIWDEVPNPRKVKNQLVRQQDLKLTPGSESPYRWELDRQRRDRQGSYRELEGALERLRLVDGGFACQMVFSVYVYRTHPEPKGNTYLTEALLMLSKWMPETIRVPARLVEERVASSRKDSVMELRAQGLSPNRIAFRLGISRKKVLEKLRAA